MKAGVKGRLNRNVRGRVRGIVRVGWWYSDKDGVKGRMSGSMRVW